jgi:carbon dioxide concentrating mechanism protein CcmN
MQLPPVHSISTTDYFVSGDVTIHASAAIAPGVILEAGSGCQIVIGAGVCIGLGTVITATDGNVEIEEGAALGPGTLVIGPVTIGYAACIGSRSTIFQQDIAALALIPAGDLLLAAPAPPLSIRASLMSPPAPSPVEDTEINPIPSPWDSGESSESPPSPSNDINLETPLGNSGPKTAEPLSADSSSPKQPKDVEVIVTQPEVTEAPEVPEPKNPVVGQVYINQLLLTLFPERKFFQS